MALITAAYFGDYNGCVNFSNVLSLLFCINLDPRRNLHCRTQLICTSKTLAAPGACIPLGGATDEVFWILEKDFARDRPR